jgi:hypothetical protein
VKRLNTGLDKPLAKSLAGFVADENWSFSCEDEAVRAILRMALYGSCGPPRNNKSRITWLRKRYGRKPQCKNIPDLPILQFLAQQDRWATWFDHTDGDHLPSVQLAMPEWVPTKLRRAKMNQLIRRGLVEGCPCGCRGDYEISEKGREYLKEQGSKNESGQ